MRRRCSETAPGLCRVSTAARQGETIYLRGFNLDHGTDFSTTVAGVPVNTPTGAHAHGYADISFLIPELVSGVQFKKRPYFADEGDFSAAGAANVNYVNRLEQPVLRLSAGEDEWGRVFGAASPRVAGGYLLAAIELNHNGGPWVSHDDHRHQRAVRFSHSKQSQRLLLTGMGYWADWVRPTRSRSAIDSGLIPRFGRR